MFIPRYTGILKLRLSMGLLPDDRASCLAQLEFLAIIENVMSTNLDCIQVNTEMINVNIDSENCCNWSDELSQDGSNKSM